MPSHRLTAALFRFQVPFNSALLPDASELVPFTKSESVFVRVTIAVSNAS